MNIAYTYETSDRVDCHIAPAAMKATASEAIPQFYHHIY